jgi:hypothetical protein
MFEKPLLLLPPGYPRRQVYEDFGYGAERFTIVRRPNKIPETHRIALVLDPFEMQWPAAVARYPGAILGFDACRKASREHFMRAGMYFAPPASRTAAEEN